MADIVELDELTINQIAAGEVVERPASVVKELVENSIDAEAKNITIEVENGGISLIRITDDGKGIKQDDVELAFERHATSKIRSSKDLEEVETMGFRGEALASIAAISKIQLITKVKEENIGTKVNLEAGDVINLQPTGATEGTSITIEDLFFNTPVRYKFLRKDYTEAGYIEEIVRKLAIINKDIAFKLVNNGKVILQTIGNGDTKSVVYSIFGEEIANSIIETNFETENIKINAIVGKPEIARSNRRNQMFFVNGRFIKDATLTSATTKAFKGLIPLGRFGFCILDIRINPSLIDVNVHPTKEEIRFKDEQEAFKAVNGAISKALSQSELVENIFVPKYDENNFTHFNSYSAVTGDVTATEKSVDEVLKQPEVNMLKDKKKAGFFNFKDKKSDKELEEELEKKHSEIYEKLMSNPKFSYQDMLKEQAENEKQEQVEKGDEEEISIANLPRFDWIGEEQSTEKLSKLQEQIDKTSALNIHTILNRYKEQVEEEKQELESKQREDIKQREELEEQNKVDEEIIEEKQEQVENEIIEEQVKQESEIEQEIKDSKEIVEEELTQEQIEEELDKQRKAEDKYKAIFDSYKPGDYLKERVEEEVVTEEVIEDKIETPVKEVAEEKPEEAVKEKQEQLEDKIVEEEKEELIQEQVEQEIEKLKDEIRELDSLNGTSILSRVQEIIAKEAITETPELKPLADEERESLKEVEKTELSSKEIIDETAGFKSAAEESFVEEREEDPKKNILEQISKGIGLDKKTDNKIEAQNIAGNLIAQKIEKGEITGVLDFDAINKILEQEIKEKEELEQAQKETVGSKFDFAKMYKRAFGVESYEEQKEKRAFEESINVSQAFKTPDLTLFKDSDIPLYSVIGVVFGTYIVIEMRDSIYMIDQHATHERLLYEEVKFNYYNDQYKDSQALLLPDVITLSYREMEIVRKNIEVFKKSGFELEEFGINTIKLVAVPSMIEILNTKELFLDILDEIDSAYVTGKDEIEDKFLSTIACKAAVKANMVLDEKEIRALLDDLLRLQNPFTCPHGRPTAIKLTKADLERKFARR